MQEDFLEIDANQYEANPKVTTQIIEASTIINSNHQKILSLPIDLLN